MHIKIKRAMICLKAYIICAYLSHWIRLKNVEGKSYEIFLWKERKMKKKKKETLMAISGNGNRYASHTNIYEFRYYTLTLTCILLTQTIILQC